MLSSRQKRERGGGEGESSLRERVVHNWAVCSCAFVPQLIERSHINFLLNALAIALSHSQQALMALTLLCLHSHKAVSYAGNFIQFPHTSRVVSLCVCVSRCVQL